MSGHARVATLAFPANGYAAVWVRVSGTAQPGASVVCEVRGEGPAGFAINGPAGPVTADADGRWAVALATVWLAADVEGRRGVETWCQAGHEAGLLEYEMFVIGMPAAAFQPFER
ncbi:MAG: hypothetical protein AB1635_01565 [Acidobacteriota bacterium]